MRRQDPIAIRIVSLLSRLGGGGLLGTGIGVLGLKAATHRAGSLNGHPGALVVAGDPLGAVEQPVTATAITETNARTPSRAST